MSSLNLEDLFGDSWIALGGECEFSMFGRLVRRVLDCSREPAQFGSSWSPSELPAEAMILRAVTDRSMTQTTLILGLSTDTKPILRGLGILLGSF